LKLLAALAALVAVAGLAKAARADTEEPMDPGDQLEKAVGEYEQNEYADAIQTLLPLLYPTTSLSSQDDVITAHRVLGISYFEMGDTVRASGEFKAILTLDPTYRLDSAVDPIDAVNYFDQVHDENEQALADAQRKLHEQEAAQAAAQAAEEEARRSRVYVTDNVEHIPFGLTLLPLGVGQFVEGRSTAGWLFLGSEAGLGLTSVALYLSVVLKYPPGTRPPPQDLPGIRQVEVAQITAGTACLLAIAWGIADAVYHYEPTRLLSTTEKVVAPASQGAPTSAPLPPLKPLSVIVVPFVAPSGGGLAVGGVF
jgi:hypothetical protein